MVKPGIKKVALDRTKEMNKSKKEELNLYLITQAYLTKKLQQGQKNRLGELKKIHLLIEGWYRRESEKIQHQSRVMKFQQSEKTTIYHHELHKRIMKKGSILRLQTDSGILEGHIACKEFLEKTVENLLLNPANLDLQAQETLLEEVCPIFPEDK